MSATVPGEGRHTSPQWALRVWMGAVCGWKCIWIWAGVDLVVRWRGIWIDFELFPDWFWALPHNRRSGWGGEVVVCFQTWDKLLTIELLFSFHFCLQGYVVRALFFGTRQFVGVFNVPFEHICSITGFVCFWFALVVVVVDMVYAGCTLMGQDLFGRCFHSDHGNVEFCFNLRAEFFREVWLKFVFLRGTGGRTQRFIVIFPALQKSQFLIVEIHSLFVCLFLPWKESGFFPPERPVAFCGRTGFGLFSRREIGLGSRTNCVVFTQMHCLVCDAGNQLSLQPPNEGCGQFPCLVEYPQTILLRFDRTCFLINLSFLKSIRCSFSNL